MTDLTKHFLEKKFRKDLEKLSIGRICTECFSSNDESVDW